MFLGYNVEKLPELINYYFNVDISTFTNFEIVVVGLLSSILILLTIFLTLKVLYSVWVRLTS